MLKIVESVDIYLSLDGSNFLFKGNLRLVGIESITFRSKSNALSN